MQVYVGRSYINARYKVIEIKQKRSLMQSYHTKCTLGAGTQV